LNMKEEETLLVQCIVSLVSTNEANF